MLSFMIDTMEGQNVSADNIPGVFLHTYYDKGDIHINMEGAIVNILEEIDTSYYNDFIYIYSCKKFMYAEYKKAIHGTIETLLLFWGKLSKSL